MSAEDAGRKYVFTISGRPVPAARMTRKGKWVKPQAQRYLAYKAEVGWIARRHCQEPLRGPLGLALSVYVAGGRTGDVDNYWKAIADALNGIAWYDDGQVAEARVVRRRVARGVDQRAEVEIWQLPEQGVAEGA